MYTVLERAAVAVACSPKIDTTWALHDSYNARTEREWHIKHAHSAQRSHFETSKPRSRPINTGEEVKKRHHTQNAAGNAEQQRQQRHNPLGIHFEGFGVNTDAMPLVGLVDW